MVGKTRKKNSLLSKPKIAVKPAIDRLCLIVKNLNVGAL